MGIDWVENSQRLHNLIIWLNHIVDTGGHKLLSREYQQFYYYTSGQPHLQVLDN